MTIANLTNASFFFHPDYTVGYGISPYRALLRFADFTAGQGFHLAPKMLNCANFLELVGRVAGEVSVNAVGIRQIEHLKDGIGSLAVLTLHDGVLDAHFLGSHIILEHSLAMQTDPCIFRAGNGDLHLRVFLHILVDVLLVVGAEPQLAVPFAGEHKRAALCLAVT